MLAFETDIVYSKEELKMFNRLLVIGLALAFGIAYAAGADLVTDGLLSYWSFDEGTVTGRTVKDIWGDRDGIIMGDTEVVEGRFGEALYFDGNGDYVGYDPTGLPEGDAPRTMCAWVRPEGAGVRAVLEWGTRLSSLRSSILIESGERVKFCGQDVDLLTADSISLNEWSLITETYDGTTMRIYFNGELVSSQGINIDTKIEGGPKEGFGRIGCNVEVAPGEFMQGAIDEASIYDRMLDDGEVMENFEAGPLVLARAFKKIEETLVAGQNRIPGRGTLCGCGRRL